MSKQNYKKEVQFLKLFRYQIWLFTLHSDNMSTKQRHSGQVLFISNNELVQNESEPKRLLTKKLHPQRRTLEDNEGDLAF